jgi:hypothetical protein
VSRRFTFVTFLVIVLAAILVGTAFAQDGNTKRVGVVVAFPEGQPHVQVVTVPSDATTFDVLKASGLTLVTQPGQAGQALCKINETGCAADNCFCDAEHFWAYYHLNGSNWEASQGSVDSYKPANGAVEGFAWSGFDKDYNPTVKPAVYTFEQLQGASSAAGPTSSRVIPILILVGLLIFGVVVLVLLLRGRSK